MNKIRKKGENKIQFAAKTAIGSPKIMISPLGVESQTGVSPVTLLGLSRRFQELKRSRGGLPTIRVMESDSSPTRN
jgi:hypothetical protein